jgi:hypothetical protein
LPGLGDPLDVVGEVEARIEIGSNPLGVVTGVSVSEPTVTVSTKFSCVGSGRLSSSPHAATDAKARSESSERIVGIDREG